MTLESLNNPRVIKSVEKITEIIQDIIHDTINIEETTTNDFYLKLGSYGEKIIEVIKFRLWYVDDIRELYMWFDLGVEWMEKEPYISERSHIGFTKLLEQKDGGWTIIDKITTDLVNLNDKYNEKD